MALFGVVLPVDDADAAHRDPEFADGPRRAAVAPDFVPQSGDQTWILPWLRIIKNDEEWWKTIKNDEEWLRMIENDEDGLILIFVQDFRPKYPEICR